jgi:hypothetical protein
MVEILKVRFHCTHHSCYLSLTSVQVTVVWAFGNSCDYTAFRRLGFY